MINTEKLSITSVEMIHGYNNAGECEFILDEVQAHRLQHRGKSQYYR